MLLPCARCTEKFVELEYVLLGHVGVGAELLAEEVVVEVRSVDSTTVKLDKAAIICC